MLQALLNLIDMHILQAYSSYVRARVCVRVRATTLLLQIWGQEAAPSLVYVLGIVQQFTDL